MSKTIQVELLTDGGYNAPAVVGKVFYAVPWHIGSKLMGYDIKVGDLVLAGMAEGVNTPRNSYLYYRNNEVRVLDADS